MLREDNSGFVQFPQMGKMFNRMDTGKTFIYLVAFDSVSMSFQKTQNHKNLPKISMSAAELAEAAHQLIETYAQNSTMVLFLGTHSFVRYIKASLKIELI
jgi:hypothetical protein